MSKTSTLLGVCVATALLLGSVACSDDASTDGVECPDGTTLRTSTNEPAGDGFETRGEAIRAELQEIGLEASDEAITAAVVAAGPGGEAGTELVEVRTEEGSVVSMTLAPLDPGWAVETSSWCA
jgi:hypothetical protein